METIISINDKNYHLAKDILNKLGLNYSQAIAVFNSLIVKNNGLPFDMKVPNQETKKAFIELAEKKGKTFQNIDELFADLDN